MAETDWPSVGNLRTSSVVSRLTPPATSIVGDRTMTYRLLLNEQPDKPRVLVRTMSRGTDQRVQKKPLLSQPYPSSANNSTVTADRGAPQSKVNKPKLATE